MYFADEGFTDANLLLGVVLQFWTDLRNFMSDGNNARVENTIQVITDTTGSLTGEIDGIGNTVSGAQAATDEWSAKQGLISMKTDAYGDGSRIAGRIFIPGVTSDFGEQVPTEAYKNGLNSAIDELITESASVASAPLAVWRRPRAATQTKPARLGGFGLVNAASASSEWAVLRSRRT